MSNDGIAIGAVIIKYV